MQQTVEESHTLSLLGTQAIKFVPAKNLKFSGKVIGQHSNAMRLTSFDQLREKLLEKTYYSVGGGFVVNEDTVGEDRIVID